MVVDDTMMDLDGGATATAGSSTTTTTPLTGKSERPKMQRSELSEILEHVSAGVNTSPATGVEAVGGRSLSEDLDADGEGESPGLDALAMAAGAAG